LPPGPITNDDLYVKVFDGKEYSMHVREDLELNKHYRGVNKEVWQLLHRMYGGGPIIVREELDIYSRDLSRDQMSKSSQRAKESIKASQRNHGSNNIFAKS